MVLLILSFKDKEALLPSAKTIYFSVSMLKIVIIL